MNFDSDTMIRIAKATETGVLKICAAIETIPLETSEDLVNMLKALEMLWCLAALQRELQSDGDAIRV